MQGIEFRSAVSIAYENDEVTPGVRGATAFLLLVAQRFACDPFS